MRVLFPKQKNFQRKKICRFGTRRICFPSLSLAAISCGDKLAAWEPFENDDILTALNPAMLWATRTFNLRLYQRLIFAVPHNLRIKLKLSSLSVPQVSIQHLYLWQIVAKQMLSDL